MKKFFIRKTFTAGILSLMVSPGLTSGANAASCSISGTTSFVYTGAVETCDVTQAGTYGITAIGAFGGGYGSEISGDISSQSWSPGPTPPTSVPEPSSLAILLAARVGLGGAMFYKWKIGDGNINKNDWQKS